MLLLFIFILVAYLLGSLSSAIIVSKCAGLPDPRTQGSENPGASNILRIGGKRLATLVLLVDVLKGCNCIGWISRFSLAFRLDRTIQLGCSVVFISLYFRGIHAGGYSDVFLCFLCLFVAGLFAYLLNDCITHNAPFFKYSTLISRHRTTINTI